MLAPGPQALAAAVPPSNPPRIAAAARFVSDPVYAEELSGIRWLQDLGAVSAWQATAMIFRARTRSVAVMARPPARGAVTLPAEEARPRASGPPRPGTGGEVVTATAASPPWPGVPWGEETRARIRDLDPDEARDALLFLSGAVPGLTLRALAAVLTPLSAVGTAR